MATQTKVATNFSQGYTEPEKAQARANIGAAKDTLATTLSDGLLSSTDKAKLDNMVTPVQSDWQVSDRNSLAYIWNKPSIPDNIFVADYGSTTFSEVSSASSSGKTLLCQKDGRVAALTGHDASRFTFSSPLDGGKSYVFTLSSDDSWSEQVIKYNLTHDLICQLKPILISGSTVTRFILCDRQKYTLDQGTYVFEPVDLYELAEWINQGDVIMIDGAVASDPWGDRYPMQITEMQCSTDSTTNKRYCTNIEVRGYAYSQTEDYYWGDNITDEATGTRYLEFQQWT